MASSSRGGLSAGPTLRPRTNRLISGLSEDGSSQSAQNHRDGTQVASSKDGLHLSGPRTTNDGTSTTSQQLRARHPFGDSGPIASVDAVKPGSAAAQGTYTGGLWGSSWNALQGLASNVLGTDNSLEQDSMATGDWSRQRRRLFETSSSQRRIASSAPPTRWGPSGDDQLQIGAGSAERRDAEVRARKRRALLSAGNNWDGGVDKMGRYKRRTSEDGSGARGRSGAAARRQDDEDDSDVLVYIHKVGPQETLAGLAIRYDCKQEILQKANRMWAHDNLQTRKVVVVPVATCGVKGKPVSDLHASLSAQMEDEEDVLQLGRTVQTTEREDTFVNSGAKPSNGWHTEQSTAQSGSGPPSTAASVGESEPIWKHESWAILPNDTSPTEIARLPRKRLGYFPPARRKSFSYSDGASVTPSASLDLPRPSGSPLPRSSLQTDYLNANEPIDSGRTLLNRPGRSSTTASLNSAGTGVSTHKPNWLQGPGGVGTLDRHTRVPGPAQDPLNRIFAQHLPNVQPPPGTTFNPPPIFPSVLDDYGQTFKTSAFASYSASHQTPAFAMNISGVEKWVRKTALNMQRTVSQLSDASTKRSGSRGPNSTIAPPLAVGAGAGDLIELVDSFDIGAEDDLVTPTNTNTQPMSDGWGLNDGKAKSNALPEVPFGMSQRRAGSSKASKKD